MIVFDVHDEFILISNPQLSMILWCGELTGAGQINVYLSTAVRNPSKS
jgi:hypothetical protein